MKLRIKILIVIFLAIILLNITSNEGFSSYYKCEKYKHNRPMENMIITNNINKNSNLKDAELYIPCTYTTAELELVENVFNEDQSIFAVSGCDNIVSKNYLWYLLEKNLGRSLASEIMPETYLLENEDDMRLFINRYDKNKYYILKKNLQRKLGLLLTKDLNEIINSKKDNFLLVQEYLPEVLTINKRKLNIRLYFVIICYGDKFGCYLYNEGKCIYANKDYDYNSKDMESHVTSLDLDYDIYKNNPLTLNDLKKYMDNNSMNYETLWTNINTNLRHVSLSIKDHLCINKNLKNNLSFQIFGPDILVDSKFKPFLLEINKGPSMAANIDREILIKNNLFIDTIALVRFFCQKHNIKKTFNVKSGHANNFTIINEA